MMLVTGCKQKQSPNATTVPDANNIQSVPVENSTHSAPKHVASTPANAVIPKQSLLDISTLLQAKDVEQILGQKQLKTDSLVGQNASADYNSLRIFLENTEKPSYGIGLQVWKLSDADSAKARFTELEDQYLSVQTIPAGLQQADGTGFISERGGIRNYLVITPPSTIIGLSCEKNLCPNWSDLIELSKVVQSRI